MLIQSFENKSNLAEWFEHRNHYSVVVTRHKDNKRTEYKLQKNDYVYDMLKVKGSVTALVNCAKDLIVNFSYISPTVTTDNKSELQGVVESEGEALSKDVCSTCGQTYTYYYPCACDTCADCGVIEPLVGSGTQCKKCYELCVSDKSNSSMIKSMRTYPKKPDDPALNLLNEVDYAPVYDDFDEYYFGCSCD